MPERGIVQGHRIRQDKLQAAIDLRRRMTPQEQTLWQYLRANRLGGFHFRRQQIIDGLIVDFYCHSAGLVLEVDGGIHASQAEYDSERDKVLRQRGLRILRIPNERIEGDLPGVLAEVAEECRRGEDRT
jgi:very-short-patch-repair endonuclease